MKKLSIVFPCHNEQAAIEEMMVRLRRTLVKTESMGWTSEIIVVEDGSTDNSRELLRTQKDIRLIVHDKPKGYGAALKSGFAVAEGRAIMFMDMDRTYRVEDIPMLLSQFQSDEWDMVFGRRPFLDSGMPLFRRLGNRFFAWALRSLLKSQMHDVCTGMRIFRRARLNDVLSLRRDGLDFSIQLTALSVLKKWRVCEVGIGYEERVGDSKLSVVKDGLQFLYVLLSVRSWAK